MKLAGLATAGALAVSLAACSGSGGGGSIPGVGGYNPGGYAACNPGTQVQLANPQPGQFNVPGNVGQIVIVANGNGGSLYNAPGQWSLVLNDGYDPPIYSGDLALVPDPTGPHPFPSDFYYAASIPTLPQGMSWNIALQQNGGSTCYPMSLQEGFST